MLKQVSLSLQAIGDKSRAVGSKIGQGAASIGGAVADRIPRPSISLPRWRSTTKSAKPAPVPPRKAPRIILPSDPGSFLASAASVRWWGVALAGGLLIVTIQLAAWIVSLFERGWALGAAGTLALAALTAGLAMATYFELAGFRRLREAAAFQKQFSENGPPEPLEKQREALRGLMNALTVPVETVALVAKELDAIDEGSAAIDYIERVVVRDLDRNAVERVKTAVWHSFGLIALSPTALSDTALFAWRALRLVREVGTVYGLRPNRVGSLWLLRQVLSDAALITAADLASDALGTILGDRLARRLSSPLAEGSLAAYRMARFGLLTIQRCRPIAFREDDQLGLYSILRNRARAATP